MSIGAALLGLIGCAHPAAACDVGAIVTAVHRPEGISVRLADSAVDESGVRAHDMLPEGSKITFKSRDAWIELLTSPRAAKPEKIPGRWGTYTVKGDCEGPSGVFVVLAFLQDLRRNGFGGATPPDAHFVGPQRSADSEGPAAAPPEFKKLGDEPYLIEAGTPSVFAAWTGAEGYLTLSDALSGREIARGETDGNARAAIDLPPSDIGRKLMLRAIAAGGASPARRIEIVPPGSAPEPPDTLAEASPAIRAAWLYVHGPAPWKLQALSRLAALRNEDLLAFHVWRHAVTDDPS